MDRPAPAPSASSRSSVSVLLLIALLVAGAFVGGWALGWSSARRIETADVLYTCSMHPQILRTQPGICPICHMKLEPVKKDTGHTIAIDPVVVQNMGLRLATVTEGPLTTRIRTVGELREPEPNNRTVTTRVAGYIEKLYADTTEMQVQAGQPLAELYSPDLIVAQEELIAARKGLARLSPTVAPEILKDAEQLLTAARRKLELWDVDAAQIAEIEKLDRARRTVVIKAPIAGVLAGKHVNQGTAVEAMKELFHVVDYSTLWLEARAYEPQLPLVKVGEKGRATFQSFPAEVFEGTVVFVAPLVDKETRTATVRLLLPNTSQRLRPGMFARVEFDVTVAARTLLVPREAVIDTGSRQIVFVAVGAGRYEPRAVHAGATGDQGEMQILDGLVAGEGVVASGQFLLDAESRFREAVRRMSGAGLASQPAEGSRPMAPIAVSAGTRERAGAVVAAYLEIARELARDRFVPAELETLMTRVETLRAAPEAEVQALADRLLTAVRTMHAASAPDERRRKFVAVSAAAIDLADRVPPAGTLVAQLFVVHCPMYPGTWLQTQETVQNPFDLSMATCGTVQRRIAAVAPDSDPSRPASGPAAHQHGR